MRSDGRFVDALNYAIAWRQNHEHKTEVDPQKSFGEFIAGINHGSVRQYRKYLAIALSNRGVLLAITGKAERARKDFRDAMQFESDIPAPATNLARLSQITAPVA